MADDLRSLPPIPPDVVKITGPIFLAYVLNWGLFGVLSMQTYQYYIEYPLDRWAIKAIVYAVYLLETLQTFVFTSSGFNTFGYGFGDMAAVDAFGIGWLTIPITSGIVAFLAQSFYAYRISMLAKSHKFTFPIMFLTVTQLATSLIIAVRIHKVGVWSNFMGPTTYILAGFWEGGSALCDIVIASCMIYYLRKRETVFEQTRVIIARLINLAIGTGAATAVVAVITLISTYVETDITLYQVTGSNLGKLYSVSMLVVLNERKRGAGSSQAQSMSISQDLNINPPVDSRQGQRRRGSNPGSYYDAVGGSVYSDVEMGTGQRIPRDLQGEIK